MPTSDPSIILHTKHPKRMYIWGTIITLILIAASTFGVNHYQGIRHSSDNYLKGLELSENKDYFGAITSFKGVIPQDKERFSLAKDKIVENSKLYIDAELEEVKWLAYNHKYGDAIVLIDKILTFDPNNETAKKLKPQYQAILTAEDVARLAVEQAKTLADTKAKADADAKVIADADAKAMADAAASAKAKTSSYSSNPSSSTTYTPSSNSVGSSENTFRSSALNVLGSIDSFHDKVLADYYQYIRARDSGNIQQANQKFSILLNDGNDIASMLNALNSVKKTQTSQRNSLVTQALQDYVSNIANIFSVLGFYTSGKLSDAQVYNVVTKNENNINDIKAIINANL